MTGDQTKVLQWARRVRDFLLGHDLKSQIAELPALRQELDDALAQFTANAAAQEAITKQGRFSTPAAQREVLALYQAAAADLLGRINKRGKRK